MVHFKLALEWTVLLSKHFDYSHFFKSKSVFTAYKFVNGINGNDDEWKWIIEYGDKQKINVYEILMKNMLSLFRKWIWIRMESLHWMNF